MEEEACSPSQTATQPMKCSGESVDSIGDFNDVYWGRLYPARPNVKCYDLTKDVTTVGKLKTCDICIKIQEIPTSAWAVMSRKHFSILRTVKEKFDAMISVIQLEDHSMNGTFINGCLVGKGQVKTLSDNSVISVGVPQNEIFYFKEAAVVNRKFPKSLQQKYHISVRLGTGAFGEVTMVFSKETGTGYAMKTILKGNKTSKKKLDTELQKLENEVKILQRIKHPNVIQLVDAMNFRSQKYIFLELMHGKDLFSCITTNKRLTEQQAKLYYYQIASGVQYLHQNEIIHRDLKPENVLLATDDVETVIKITDFGLSKMLHPDTFLRSLCGTKLYVAPEVLESGGSRVYTGQVDVWSMGVILFVCLSGQTPFSAGRNGLTMDEQIRSGKYTMHPSSWECVSDPAKSIVQKMMTLDPASRISVEDIFQHQWLQDAPMKRKVKDLLLRANLLPVEQSMSPVGKENIAEPLTTAPVGEENIYPSSPVPASLKFMSPPASPLRKRRRLRCNP